MLLLLSALAAAADLVVAVNYFDAHTIRPELEPLGRGATDMLITDLGQAPGLLLVERARLSEVLAELSLVKGGFVDPATAQQLGKGVGANVVVVGSITVAVEGMRLDVRAIDVATGEVRATAQATGREDDFFRLEHEVAEKLLAGLGVGTHVAERPLALGQILDGARAIDSADAAMIARLTALREYRARRLTREVDAATGWVVHEGGNTMLSARQFMERTADADTLERMRRARGIGGGTTVGMLVAGAATVAWGGVLLDAPAPDEDTPPAVADAAAERHATGIGVTTAGVVLVVGSLIPARVGRDTRPAGWYTVEEADARIRAYNEALAASLGVSRGDVLQLDVSGR